jgi:hypothetical protein
VGIGEASGPNRAIEAAKLAILDLERNGGITLRSSD